MNAGWKQKTRIGCVVLLVVVILMSTVQMFKCLALLRPSLVQNLRPFFQSDDIWCSQDGKITFQANQGLVAKGIIYDGASPVDVEVTTDISAYYVFVYIPTQMEDGTPIHDPALNLEEWEYRGKGEDWFTVEVVKSTYYKTGDMITFYMQKDQTE